MKKSKPLQNTEYVIPANAGIQAFRLIPALLHSKVWIPAFAGMTCSVSEEFLQRFQLRI
jgi:hypothetical protein